MSQTEKLLLLRNVSNRTKLDVTRLPCLNIGSALWNLLATLLRLPVSGTHSILGSILGFTLVAKGMTGIKWMSLGKVVASWFISPLASGIVCVIGYYLLHTFVLKTKGRNRRRLLLALLPAFFGITVFINSFSILFRGPSFLTPFPDSELASIFFPLGLSFLICAFVWLLVLFLWVPRQKAAIDGLDSTQGLFSLDCLLLPQVFSLIFLCSLFLSPSLMKVLTGDGVRMTLICLFNFLPSFSCLLPD